MSDVPGTKIIHLARAILLPAARLKGTTERLIDTGFTTMNYPLLRKSALLISLFTATHSLSFASDTSKSTAADLIEMDFEELVNMSVEVQSAGKNLTRAMDLPYAAFVISASDIQNSGSQSIVEALRLAPGVSVNQISAGEWAVGIRGVGGRFSRFVLVMVDGRIAYNSAFSGVNWDELNIPLQEIDHIEIIRGPNAAAWGANAVNGIIHIITRQPDKTRTAELDVWGGSSNRAGMSVSKSFAAGGDWQLGVAGHVTQIDGLETFDKRYEEPAHKTWRTSAKLTNADENHSTNIAFEIFGARQSPEWSWVDYNTVQTRFSPINEKKTGWVLQASHQQNISSSTYWKVRSSLDRSDRETDLYDWDSLNLQVDAEVVGKAGDHLLSAGINTRSTDSTIAIKENFSMAFVPEQRKVNHYGIFVSDVYQVHSKLQLTLSARLDRSELSETNIQPSIRALWSPDKNNRFWFAASQASSTPSRAILDISNVPYALIPAQQPAQPFPIILILDGHTGDKKDTQLKALELGYRKTFNTFNFDFTLFDFKYSDEVTAVLTGEPELVLDENFMPSYLRQSALFENSQDFSSTGAEISIHASLTDYWSTQFSLSALSVEKTETVKSSNASLLNSIQINPDIRLNFWLRYSRGYDDTASAFATNTDIYGTADNYLIADASINWSLSPALSLDFIANNIGEKHGEALREEFATAVMLVEPYALLKARFSF